MHKTIIIVLLAISSGIMAAEPDGFAAFDQIYTINLERSTARHNHVINEFKRIGIKKYIIFKATDMDSQAVQFAMQSDFVKKYPPCFRCKQIFCKCANNVLIKQQIGNWISFINVFKDVIKHNYNLVLITEDDVKFKDNAAEIIKYITMPATLAQYHINLDRPLLIRLEDRGQTQRGKDPIGLVPQVVMSNACFIVNRQYAESFLKNLQQIDHTSDVFIQYKILFLDPTIQHFAAYPAPAYQLSDSPTAVFYSEIHPKGIDAADRQRQQQHKKRITYLEYLKNKLCFWQH